MTVDQEAALTLTIEAELWRREVGLSPGWRATKAVWRELQEIERYWRWRDRVTEEKNS